MVGIKLFKSGMVFLKSKNGIISNNLWFQIKKWKFLVKYLQNNIEIEFIDVPKSDYKLIIHDVYKK